MFYEKTKKEITLFRGKILTLRADEVILENGKESVREVVEHSGGSAVLCVRNGKIIFVRQYRYAPGEEVLEIPAGKLEKGEDPATCAVRELEEECGLKAESVKPVAEIFPSPGYTNERIYIYEAQGITDGAANPDDDEFLSVTEMDAAEAKKILRDGGFKDAKTVIALQYYFLKEESK